MKPLIVIMFVLIAGASTAYSQRKYADLIPQPHKFPDPCDNPTVKRWEPMDQKGNFNYITPAKVLDALKLVREGRMIRLDHDRTRSKRYHRKRYIEDYPCDAARPAAISF